MRISVWSSDVCSSDLFLSLQNHFARLVGPFVECQLHAAALLELRQHALGRVGIGYACGALVGVLRRRRPVLLRTPVVGDAVVGDAVQPAGERGVRRPAGARCDHPLPDVLEQVVGQRTVAQLAQQEPVEAGTVARVELLECPRPPAAYASIRASKSEKPTSEIPSLMRN